MSEVCPDILGVLEVSLMWLTYTLSNYEVYEVYQRWLKYVRDSRSAPKVVTKSLSYDLGKFAMSRWLSCVLYSYKVAKGCSRCLKYAQGY
jgi:hypothetical protein